MADRNSVRRTEITGQRESNSTALRAGIKLYGSNAKKGTPDLLSCPLSCFFYFYFFSFFSFLLFFGQMLITPGVLSGATQTCVKSGKATFAKGEAFCVFFNPSIHSIVFSYVLLFLFFSSGRLQSISHFLFSIVVLGSAIVFSFS